MSQGARTPEELEALFEDAFVLRDGEAVALLFEQSAVLVDDGNQQARGGGQIARSAAALWERDYSYLAAPRRVLQARDTALVLTKGGVNVARRGPDRAWRYAISLLDMDHSSEGKNR